MKIKNLFIAVLFISGFIYFTSCTKEQPVKVDNYLSEATAVAKGDQCKYKVTKASAAKGHSLPSGVVVGLMVCIECDDNCADPVSDIVMVNPAGDTLGWFSGDLTHTATRCSSCSDGTKVTQPTP